MGLPSEEEVPSRVFFSAVVGIPEPAVTFIRWGRADCSGNATDLVYSGSAGGSHFSHKGAAVDFVCLPPDPSRGQRVNNPPNNGGLMYGAEYEDEVIYGVPDRKKEVPCAMCRISAYSTQIMIPARTTCYPGWEEAYRGYLAAGRYDHPAATQYVCVDEHPQVLADSSGRVDDNGKLFYPVKAKCGSLKCPPYVSDAILSCVVCVK
ncbi:short-chain collagen C4-like [Mizuhopecten yessoensis]|uniref:short-chain collagen C4-like n=1 Tax=Mizuhopecten yessoensis TaxID=6573 RepID=UPI000B45C7BD|nr:short-chain collagen C4-like [Mizuhopecten yessoensis]